MHPKPEYISPLVKPMSNEYRIEPAGTAFILVDDLGEQVGTYPTEDAAQQDIERCRSGGLKNCLRGALVGYKASEIHLSDKG